MVVSSIRVAIYKNQVNDPFPESCQAPVTVTCFEEFDLFIKAGADIYIDSGFNPESGHNEALVKLLPAVVLVNAVQYQGALVPEGVIRYNGWPGFGAGNVLELATEADNIPDQLLMYAMACGLTCIPVPDTVGLVRPRIVAMIINEAYFAAGEGVGTIAAIDTAMKLGTNYPYGPFEWSRIIGIRRVMELLANLSLIDPKYQPAPALVAAAQQE